MRCSFIVLAHRHVKRARGEHRQQRVGVGQFGVVVIHTRTEIDYRRQ